MINQTDLRYFDELARTLHLTRAAERIGISQPALSHCLKRIEAEIGQTLFLRSKKGVQLTAAGIKLQKSAADLIQSWEALKLSVQNEVTEMKGLIRLGCHSAVAGYMLPAPLAEFMQRHPGVAFQLTHGLSRHMTEQVVSSSLDVAIAVNPLPNLDLVIRELCKDEVCIWQSKKNRNKDVLIVEPSLLQTQDIQRKLRRAGIQFSRVVESASLEVIASLVSAGAGCGIVPERVLKSHGAESFIRLPGTPHFTDRICLVYKKEFRRTKRGQAFIQQFVV